MGFFDRLLGKPPEVSMSRDSLHVAGESHYQKALRSIAGLKCKNCDDMPVRVELRREPSNPHDANAVQCLIAGKVVGYINRQDAPRLQNTLHKFEQNGQRACVDGRIVKNEGEYEVEMD